MSRPDSLEGVLFDGAEAHEAPHLEELADELPTPEEREATGSKRGRH